MLFACEGISSIHNPKPSQIKRALGSMRSYGKSSFSSLTDDQGNYLQVAGGGVTCLLEIYRADINQRMRAFGNTQNKAFPDGTRLVFRAGEIPMMSDEWFKVEQVIDVFCCFLENRDFPIDVHWRPSPVF
jgi:hypothetical protein